MKNDGLISEAFVKTEGKMWVEMRKLRKKLWEIAEILVSGMYALLLEGIWKNFTFFLTPLQH